MINFKHKIRLLVEDHKIVMDTYQKIKTLGAKQKYNREKREETIENVSFINFWRGGEQHKWFYYFMKHRELLSDCNKNISVFSIGGTRKAIKWDDSEIKIFYTGENVKDNATNYVDTALDCPEINLSLGFDHLEDERYLRFPLWIVYLIKPDVDSIDINKLCEKWNSPTIIGRTKYASHISSHDMGKTRKQIVSALNNIGHVDCAGKYLHNDDSLITKYNDNKLEYLKEYFFNICPENSNCEGYVTEKIFDAIDAGCIPVYFGSNNYPEPKILNQDAIIFWDKDKENKAALKLIEDLYSNKKLMKEFLEQPRLMPGAAEEIIEMFDALEKNLRRIINY